MIPIHSAGTHPRSNGPSLQNEELRQVGILEALRKNENGTAAPWLTSKVGAATERTQA